MGYTIAGTYVAACDCKLLCPCPVDGPPTGKNDECHGVFAFRIDQGSLDDVDLAGVKAAMVNRFTSNISAGNWEVGVIIDDGASDEQAQAIERIFSGQAGGPFGEFVPLIGNFAGVSRGSIEMTDKSAKVAGAGEFTYDQFMGPDGNPTVERSAPFGFAPEYRVGRSSGTITPLGNETQANYGESAEFEFSSEETGAVHPRA
jgi:hypothetical protein